MVEQHTQQRLADYLTVGEAAEFLDISLRTSHGYANGDPIPEAIAKLLRLMVRLELKPKDVR